jgi:RimJ/RimL family protein N-acetyltransferase
VSTEDAVDMFSALSHPGVGDFIGGPVADSPESMQHVIERWVAGPQSKDAQELWFNYIVRLSDGTAIGHAQATVHSSWAEVAWVLGTPWWGKGLGFETATLLLRELVANLSTPTAWATVHPDNVRSVRLLVRLGFQEVAVTAAPVLGSYDPGDLVFSRSLL